MLVTLFGMVIEVKPVQPKNARSPMLVTLVGMVIEVKPVQPENAQALMLVTLLGITRSVTRLPLRYKLAPVYNGFA